MPDETKKGGLTGRGGPGRGQGRRGVAPNEPTERTTITLPIEEMALLRRLGGGTSASKGIRELLRRLSETGSGSDSGSA